MDIKKYYLYKRALYEPGHKVAIPDTVEYRDIPAGGLGNYLHDQVTQQRLRRAQDLMDTPVVTGTNNDDVEERRILKHLKRLGLDIRDSAFY